MTQEFDHARASFRASQLGRVLANLGQFAITAWRPSACRATTQRLANAWNQQPAPDRIRAIAIAIAVAAAMQPILISMMPRTIRPAMPAYLFAAVALLAAAAAWRADSIATAWPSSTIARLLRR